MITANRRPNDTVRGRELLIMLFLIYLALLAWTVLWKLQIPYLQGGSVREIKIIPFVATAGLGANEPSEVIANVALFVPFGIYLGLIVRRRWSSAAVIIFGASLILEIAQYVLAVGSSDVTDLIANTGGGLVGLVVVAFARVCLRGHTVKVLTRVCLIGTLLALVAVGAFLASPIRYA